MRAAVDEIMPQAASKKVHLKAEIWTQDIGDRSTPIRHRLRQVVGNLLGNAVKFTPSGGRRFTCALQDRLLIELSVADTGQGIERRFSSRSVFTAFSQAEATSTRIASAGWVWGSRSARSWSSCTAERFTPRAPVPAKAQLLSCGCPLGVSAAVPSGKRQARPTIRNR